jgi:LEA14-like dessication related protein
LTGLLAACWPVFRTPEVRLDTVRLSGLGLRGASLIANLVVANPNRFDLRTQALSYDVDLTDPDAVNSGWVRLANGVLDREFRIPARDSAILEIPLEVSYSGVSSALRSILETGTFDYRIGGEINVSEPVTRRVPFRRTGKVSIITSP